MRLCTIQLQASESPVSLEYDMVLTSLSLDVNPFRQTDTIRGCEQIFDYLSVVQQETSVFRSDQITLSSNDPA